MKMNMELKVKRQKETEVASEFFQEFNKARGGKKGVEVEMKKD